MANKYFSTRKQGRELSMFLKKSCRQRKTQKKTKEKRKKKTKKTHTKKPKRKKFKNRERNKKPVFFSKKKIAEGKKSRKTKRQEHIDPEREISDQ